MTKKEEESVKRKYGSGSDAGCSYCTGTGRQKCPRCFAIVGFVDDCEFCKGKGNIDCLVCLGRGSDQGYVANPMWT